MNDIIEKIPSNVTYVTGTHDIVIKRIKEMLCVKNGDVLIETFLIANYQKDINKFRREILKESCDFCTQRENCRNYQVKHTKQKDKQDIYAVTIRRK